MTKTCLHAAVSVKKPQRSSLLWVLLLSLLLCTLPLQAAESDATEAQISSLKRNINKLRDTLNSQNQQADKITKALRKNDLEIARIAKQLVLLDDQLSRLGSRAGDLESRRDALRKEINRRGVLLSKQIRAQYQSGLQPRLQLILTEQDPEELSRMMAYFDRVNAVLAQQVRLFRERLDNLATTESSLSETEQKIVVKQRELKLEAQSLEKARRARAQTLAEIQKDIKASSSRLAQWQADQKRLEGVLAEVRQSIDKAALARDGRDFASLKGKLLWPLVGPVQRTFGSSRNGIVYDGIWIKGSPSKPVKAAHHGRVVFSDWFKSYGLVIIVDHGGRYLTLYGHNETLLRDVGDWVSAGEEIATVGSTGGASTSGTYFAIRDKTKAIDPSAWLGPRR